MYVRGVAVVSLSIIIIIIACCVFALFALFASFTKYSAALPADKITIDSESTPHRTGTCFFLSMLADSVCSLLL